MRRDGLQNANEPLACRSLDEVLEGVNVEVAVLRVELGVRAVAEVAEVPAGDADVSVDDPDDLLLREAVHVNTVLRHAAD